MCELSKSQKQVIERAKELELERVEIYARAMEERVADLLPESFSNFDAEMEDPVEVRITLGLTAEDADSFSDRECRNPVRFFGEECDRARAERNFLESQDD